MPRIIPQTLSPEQSRFFGEAKDEWNDPAYYIRSAMQLLQPMRGAEVIEAIGVLLDLHPALRSQIVELPGGVFQTQDGTIGNVIGEKCFPDECRDQRERASLLNQMSESIELDLGKSMCKFVLCMSKNVVEDVLIVVHHAVCDGASFSILLEDFELLLRWQTPISKFGGNEFLSFVDIRASYMGSQEHLRSLEFWKETMEGVPRFYWRDPEAAVSWQFDGSQQVFEIDRKILQAASENANKRITQFFLSFHAFSASIMRLTDHEDIVIGIPISLRPPGFERTVGMFANIIPLRASHAQMNDPAKAQRAIWDAFDHRYAPLDHILDSLCGYRDGQTQRLFGAMLNVLPKRDASSSLSPILREYALTTTKATFALTLFINELGDRSVFTLEHAHSDIEPVSAVFLAEEFQARIISMAAG